MEDDRRYSTRAGAERGNLPRSIYPAYMEPTYTSLASHNLFYSSVQPRSSQDYLDRDIEPLRYRDYGLDNVSGMAVHTESGLSGISTGVNIRSYISPFEDPNLVNQRPDVSRLINPGIPEPLYERNSSLQRDDGHISEPLYGRNSSLQRDDGHISEPLYGRNSSLQRDDGLSGSVNESSMLFVDGLPRDCTRREVGHLFRPFIGFKDIRVVHKEPRRTGDKAMVLCFVEFDNPTCARTAMDALQGYQFDHKKVDSSVLRIHFAHFPFKPPSASADR